jgi:hypothetical protein
MVIDTYEYLVKKPEQQTPEREEKKSYMEMEFGSREMKYV